MIVWHIFCSHDVEEDRGDVDFTVHDQPSRQWFLIAGENHGDKIKMLSPGICTSVLGLFRIFGLMSVQPNIQKNTTGCDLLLSLYFAHAMSCRSRHKTDVAPCTRHVTRLRVSGIKTPQHPVVINCHRHRYPRQDMEHVGGFKLISILSLSLLMLRPVPHSLSRP
jgi:hypothetical protein